MHVMWTLNGQQINVLDGITTTSTNRKTNQLTIESAQAHHSGEYTCVAKNSVGASKYSSYLNVNGIHHNIPCLIDNIVESSQNTINSLSCLHKLFLKNPYEFHITIMRDFYTRFTIFFYHPVLSK